MYECILFPLLKKNTLFLLNMEKMQFNVEIESLGHGTSNKLENAKQSSPPRNIPPFLPPCVFILWLWGGKRLFVNANSDKPLMLYSHTHLTRGSIITIIFRRNSNHKNIREHCNAEPSYTSITIDWGVISRVICMYSPSDYRLICRNIEIRDLQWLIATAVVFFFLEWK